MTVFRLRFQCKTKSAGEGGVPEHKGYEDRKRRKAADIGCAAIKQHRKTAIYK